jgi:hypothetical protein
VVIFPTTLETKGVPAMIYLYVKTHNKTVLKYLGKTNSKDPHKYPGSGLYWTKHLKVHGIDYTTEILLATEDKEELKETGLFFSKLFNIVKSKEWANIMEEYGQGGAWNKGLNAERDDRIKRIAKNMSITKRNSGFYEECGKYLPKLYGDENPMKRPEQRKRMSELASRRYRIYKEDGTWSWGYRPLLEV